MLVSASLSVRAVGKLFGRFPFVPADPVPFSLSLYRIAFAVKMVNIPKTRKTFCAHKDCRNHQAHKVTQYKTGKASLFAQG